MNIKNNGGFTLIELLVTVLLMAVISMITFVSIAGVINKSKSNECNALKNNIENATKEYYSDLRLAEDYHSGGTYTITAQTLVSANYLIDKGAGIAYDKINIEVTLNNDWTITSIVISSNEEIFKDCNNG